MANEKCQMKYGKSTFPFDPVPSCCLAETNRQECLSYLQQTTQSLFYSYPGFPTKLLANAIQVRHIINRHRMRQGFIIHDHGFQLDQSCHRIYYLQQRRGVFPSTAKIIQAVSLRRLDERLACSREIVHMQYVANGMTSERKPNRPAPFD